MTRAECGCPMDDEFIYHKKGCEIGAEMAKAADLVRPKKWKDMGLCAFVSKEWTDWKKTRRWEPLEKEEE